MDNKKLIGTVLGVVAFIALIAGATFAWLTINANVTNASVNGTSRNFLITYTGSAQIGGNIPQIKSGQALTSAITSQSQASAANDSWVAVTAAKTANSAAAGSFKLMLHVDTNTMKTNSLLFAVCKGACPANVALATAAASGGSGTTPPTVTPTCGSGVTACGVINKGTANSDVLLYNDTTTFNTDAAVSTQTYNIYIWANADTLSDGTETWSPGDSDGDMGKGLGGYIYATASQVNN